VADQLIVVRSARTEIDERTFRIMCAELFNPSEFFRPGSSAGRRRISFENSMQ
jgi:hypothetical protein